MSTELGVDQALGITFDSGFGAKGCTAEAAPTESGDSKFSPRSNVLFLAVSIHL